MCFNETFCEYEINCECDALNIQIYLYTTCSTTLHVIFIHVMFIRHRVTYK